MAWLSVPFIGFFPKQSAECILSMISTTIPTSGTQNQQEIIGETKHGSLWIKTLPYLHTGLNLLFRIVITGVGMLNQPDLVIFVTGIHYFIERKPTKTLDDPPFRNY
jgi:hypothetical protein